MSEAWSPKKFADVRAKLFSRAATDATFRQLCLTDPRAAVRAISGVEPPADYPWRFAERGPGAHVLPPFQPSNELSEQEMEMIVGGAAALAITVSGPQCANTYHCG